MIEVANQANSAPNIEYVVRDARSVSDNPEWQERFDKVVSFFVFHWIPTEDHTKALASTLACLKTGGEGLFIIDNKCELDFPKQAHLYLENHTKWDVYLKVNCFTLCLFRWCSYWQKTLEHVSQHQKHIFMISYNVQL